MYKRLILILFISLLTFSNTAGWQPLTGIYYISGTLYSSEYPNLTVGSTDLIINGDTIRTDSFGRFLYPIHWSLGFVLGIPIKYYADNRPKYLIIECGNQKFVFKNKFVKYGYRAKKAHKYPERRINLEIKPENVTRQSLLWIVDVPIKP